MVLWFYHNKCCQSRKLCQVTKNTLWKRNRNMYAIWLLDMVLNKKIEKPFTKVPSDGNLEMLQITEVKAKLSNKVKNFLNNRDKSEERRTHLNLSTEDFHSPSKMNASHSHRTTIQPSITVNDETKHDLQATSKEEVQRSASGSKRRIRKSAKFGPRVETNNLSFEVARDSQGESWQVEPQ